MVARPDRSSLTEAARTQVELADLNIRNLRLVVNAVYQPAENSDPVAASYAAVVQDGLDSMPESLQSVPTVLVPMLPGNIVGRTALEALLEPPNGNVESVRLPELGDGASLSTFVDDLARPGHGVVMTMGKGGVGKTTVAVAIARELAERGHRVLLTTTDPAGNVMAVAGELPANLQIARIDPAAEVAAYTEAAIAKAADTLDPEGLELLREDLRSPCTEEIAVFRAFAEAVAQGEDRFVVIDTAPTGHTILLMDATEAYHREVARTQSDAPDSVRNLLPRLRDPEFTRVVIVTLAEPTPVHEAEKLQEELRRAGIEPFGWVVNRSLCLTGPTEPVLAGKAASEANWVAEVAGLANRRVVLPWTASRGIRTSVGSGQR